MLLDLTWNVNIGDDLRSGGVSSGDVQVQDDVAEQETGILPRQLLSGE